MGSPLHTDPCYSSYLLVLVLLQVAWRHQALRVDVVGDSWLSDELRVRVHVLHLEEGQNVVDLQIVGAVCHGLPLRGQAARCHPVGIWLLLHGKEGGGGYAEANDIQGFSLGPRALSNVVTAIFSPTLQLLTQI